jgi:hypothetical protein
MASWQSPSGNMSEEQWWAFDTQGFLVVRDALSPETLQSLRAAADPAEVASVLQSVAAIQNYLTQLCGGSSPQVDTSDLGFCEGLVQGGNESRAPGLRRDSYYNIGQVGGEGQAAGGARLVSCSRLVVVCAVETEAATAVELVPSSHLSLVAPPPALLRGSDCSFCATPLGISDVLLVSGATLRRFQQAAAQALVMCSFCSSHAPPPVIEKGASDMPGWVSELSETQQLLLWPYRTAEERPAEVVLSDGVSNWLGPEHSAGAHPTLMASNPAALVDAAEMFHFDKDGYLVLEGVMDSEWLALANAAVEANLDRVILRESTSRF